VQENEQRPSLSTAVRRDENFAQAAPSEPAVQREAHDVRAVSAPVAATDVANGEPADRRQEHDCRQREPASHRREATDPRYTAGKLGSWRGTGG